MTCKNMTLIKKIAPTIFNAYNAFFDDIFELFINELLTEKVHYLNRIEQKQLIRDGEEDSREEHTVRKVRELIASS